MNKEEENALQELIGNYSKVIVYNDDHNTFEHVIESLVEVCGHDPVQAEQCAVITHFKGSCEVKTGNLNILNGMCKSLNSRNLSSEIKS